MLRTQGQVVHEPGMYMPVQEIPSAWYSLRCTWNLLFAGLLQLLVPFVSSHLEALCQPFRIIGLEYVSKDACTDEAVSMAVEVFGQSMLKALQK